MANIHQQIKTLKLDLTSERDRILNYWYYNAQDYAYGGFVGRIDHGNNVVDKASKGVILNTRILWTFSAAYNQLADPRWKAMADRAYEYIQRFFVDNTYEGVIWELDFLNIPVNCRKQTYAQAFAIYAFCEYYKVCHKKDVLAQALHFFDTLQKHCKDEKLGGYIEAFDRDWTPISDMRLSNKDANEKKTMNTHLHVLEAFTNLCRVAPDSKVKAAQRELIHLFLDRFITKDFQLNLFFDERWNRKGNEISFGHDIETSWLLYEAAEVLGDADLVEKTAKVAIKMVDKVIAQGVDSDGSVMNHYNPETGKLDSDRHWWPQAEAMVGFYNAYEISGNEKYISNLLNSWAYVKNYIIDNKNGEWFWRVDKNGKPYSEEEKVGFWKCPYHNTRTCLEIIERINKK